MNRQAKPRKSGLAKYLESSLRKDPRARVLFFAELMKAPVSSQLRLLRHFRGLSQVKLSRKVKLLQPEIVRLEREGSNPRTSTLERVAVGLGARVELVPEKLLPFLAAQQLRAQGQAYFQRIALPHA
ncbi:MAG: helix-turn-helix domain-containing protein [Elusimicrobia bacterium]|nr:helix-turn-helix domain-containing protein [Elusimicrobiota bacterium]